MKALTENNEIKEDKNSISHLEFGYYEISEMPEFDYYTLAKELDSDDQSTDKELFSINDYLKTMNHSLFTPVLIYSLNFLKKNFGQKEKYKLNIGLSEINSYDILYVNLNKEIYDIFFQRAKKTINEIDIDFSKKEEKYLIYKQKKVGDSCDKQEIFKNFIFDNNKEKEYDFENISYVDLCLLKQKEIISSFRMGYSFQERIIEIFERNKTFRELPNLIFFQKKKNKLYYNEYDRILFLEKDETFHLFKVYYSIEDSQENIHKDGKNLSLSENSLNFIEVKKSLSSLNIKLDKNNNDSSTVNSKNTSLYYSVNNIKNFLELYKKLNLNEKFKKINLLYIFNSYYQFNMIQLLQEIFEKEIKNNYEISKINIYFIQIDSDYEEIDNLYKEDLIHKVNRKMDELKERFEKMEKNYEIKIKNSEDEKKIYEEKKKDYEEREKKYEENENKYKENEKKYAEKIKKYEELLNEKEQIKTKKKFIKKLFNDIENSQLEKFYGTKEIDFLIGKNYSKNKIKCNESIENIFYIDMETNYKSLLDTKSFIGNNEYDVSIDDYFKRLENIEKIILLVETDFLTQLIHNNFLLKNYTINGYTSTYEYFLLTFENNHKEKDKEKKINIALKEYLIPSFGKNEYILNNYFISYFKRVKNFIKNITSKINDEMMIYSQKDDAYLCMVKYYFVNNADNKNNSNNIININNSNNISNSNNINIANNTDNEEKTNNTKAKSKINLFFLKNKLYLENKKIEDYIKEKTVRQDNILIIENQLSPIFDIVQIRKFFEIIFNKGSMLLTLDFNKKDGVGSFSIDDYKIVEYIVNKGDYFQLKKNNEIILTIKSKTINKSSWKKDDFKITLNQNNLRPDFIKFIDINYTEEKLNLFLSSVFFNNKKKKKQVLLLGDEFHYIKFFLSRYFIEDLLNIFHVEENEKQRDGLSKMLGLKENNISLIPKKDDKEKEEPDENFLAKNPYEYLADIKKESFDIIIIDDNIKKDNSIPSFYYFEKGMNNLIKGLKKNGVITFNLFVQNQEVLDKLMILFESNFLVLKKRGLGLNWLFILVKKEKNEINMEEIVENNIKDGIVRNNILNNINEFVLNFLKDN